MDDNNLGRFFRFIHIGLSGKKKNVNIENYPQAFLMDFLLSLTSKSVRKQIIMPSSPAF
jgi:hypothetical protein